MSSTPLNPDGIEAGAKALLAVQQPEVSAEYAWNVQFEDGRDELRNEARAAVSAYLSADTAEVNTTSKPKPNFELVTSVEELDALPKGSILRDYVGLALHKRKTGNWWVTNGDHELASAYLADEIADTAYGYTVLYRPEVDE